MATYDPKDVNVVVDGDVVVGFGDGTFVQCEKMQDNFTEHIGAQGEVDVAINADDTGEITITVKQTSPSNSKLNKIANSKKEVPIEVIDLNDQGFKAGGNKAYIRKPAAIERSNEISTREYTFFVADYKQDE